MLGEGPDWHGYWARVGWLMGHKAPLGLRVTMPLEWNPWG